MCSVLRFAVVATNVGSVTIVPPAISLNYNVRDAGPLDIVVTATGVSTSCSASIVLNGTCAAPTVPATGLTLSAAVDEGCEEYCYTMRLTALDVPSGRGLLCLNLYTAPSLQTNISLNDRIDYVNYPRRVRPQSALTLRGVGISVDQQRAGVVYQGQFQCDYLSNNFVTPYAIRAETLESGTFQTQLFGSWFT